MTNTFKSDIINLSKEREVITMMVTLEIVCPFCGKLHFVEVLESELDAYNSGALAQVAFPNLSATEREQIISGICPKCQDSIFGGDDE